VRFSVVIPTHQRRDTVVRTVGALAGQSLADFEAIVVVDGSTDGTAAALRALGTPFTLSVLEQPNRGAGAARNAGADAARGELLLFLDDDMEADPKLLAEHDRAHREGADVVLGDLPLHPDSPRNVLSAGVESWARARHERLASAADVPIADLLTGQLSVARDVFHELGGFDAGFTRDGAFGGEDVDFGYRVQRAGRRVIFNPAAISRQYFDVDPARYLRREFEAGRSDAELIAKHPERAPELAGRRTFRSRRSRFLLRPLVSAPGFVSAPLRWVVAGLVRSGRGGARLTAVFQAVRTLEHARGVRAAQAELSSAAVIVLGYHAIQDLADDPVLADYSVPPERFGAQLDELRAQGWWFVDLDRVLRALDGDAALPPRALLLTFDDAYEDLQTAALPLLRERGLPAVAFAVAGHVGGVNEWDRAKGARSLSLLGAEGLLELAAAGVEVGSHAFTHRPLTRVPAEDLPHELIGSADLLESLGLPRPRALAYPHGACTREVADRARRAGYSVAFTIDSGVVTRHSNRWALPRVEVRASYAPDVLSLKVASAGRSARASMPRRLWRSAGRST